MYTPSAFVQADVAKTFDAMERFSFALLISNHEGAPFASHLPILLERHRGAHGTLVGHMARANPQWQQADGQTVLAVFSGPHAYISPTWYAEKNTVPTWNYQAIHATGIFRAIHDPHELMEILGKTVQTYEQSQPAPWAFEADSEFNRKLAEAIVGFRIEITKLESKSKLSQNHSRERREKVIAELAKSDRADDQAIAALMQQTLE